MDAEKYANLMKIGASAMESIQEMVDALNCDYDRLEELRDARNDHERENEGQAALPWETVYNDDSKELAELEAAAGECKSQDEARERIQDDALSVQVRSDWYTPGEVPDAPEEFCILLTTGGPAVRIRGELDQYQQPCRAWLEVQDWFLPWTEYQAADSDTLLTYAQVFYFGE
jgi:hypothetical protein